MTTIAKRLERVTPLIDQYRCLPGQYPLDMIADDEAPFIDLITDLLHLAHSLGIDADKLMDTAAWNFEAEISGDGEGL